CGTRTIAEFRSARQDRCSYGYGRRKEDCEQTRSSAVGAAAGVWSQDRPPSTTRSRVLQTGVVWLQSNTRCWRRLKRRQCRRWFSAIARAARSLDRDPWGEPSELSPIVLVFVLASL